MHASSYPVKNNDRTPLPNYEGIEHIHYNKSLLAIIIYHTYYKEGTTFLTETTFPQQIAFIAKKTGDCIIPHTHNTVKREIRETQETLFIRKGKIKVHFFTSARRHVASRVLQKGDTVFLASGGHGFEVIEDTEMIEVKQGPYTGDDDKTRFSLP